MMKLFLKMIGITCLIAVFTTVGIQAQTTTPTEEPTMQPTVTPSSGPTEPPTYTPYPTYTPLPTYTALPTYTQLPTHTPQSTQTPYPTQTPWPTYTMEPTVTPYPTQTPYPTHTPYPTPTGEVAPVPYVGWISNIPENGYVDTNDILSQGFTVYAPKSNQRYAVSMNVGGLELFYPYWQLGTDPTNFLQKPDHLGLNTIHLWTFPFIYYFIADMEFSVCLYEPVVGGGWREIDRADHMIHFVSDPPPTPEEPCRVGEALVRITNIPIMSDGTKDAYNKQILFCLQDEDRINFAGVYHRYVQPNWPYGNWWPAWRMESGDYGCWEEWNIWEAGDLYGSTAEFHIVWNYNSISITHTGTGDTQILPAHNIPAFNMMSQSSDCQNWGWDSPAQAELLDWKCTEEGPPDPC